MGATKMELSSSLYSDEVKGSWFGCACVCVSQAEQSVQPVTGTQYSGGPTHELYYRNTALGGYGPRLSISLGDREELGTQA